MLKAYAMKGMAQSALDEVHLNRWPIVYGLEIGQRRGEPLRAHSRSELLAGLAVQIHALESLSRALLSSIRD